MKKPRFEVFSVDPEAGDELVIFRSDDLLACFAVRDQADDLDVYDCLTAQFVHFLDDVYGPQRPPEVHVVERVDNWQ